MLNSEGYVTTLTQQHQPFEMYQSPSSSVPLQPAIPGCPGRVNRGFLFATW